MHLQWIILFVCSFVKSTLSQQQQQCVQLQNCMDLTLKTITDLQQYSSSYNAISVHTGSAQCRSLRTNFECMINYTPYCLRSDMTRNSPQYISQAKQLLDLHCDQGTSWSNTQCYRKQEITQNCETMLPEINVGSYNYYSASIPRHICEKYQRFRHCAYNVVLTQCTPIERETFFSYLYDKVQEISFKCGNDTLFFENYERYHPLTSPIYNGIVANPINLAQPPYIYGSANYAGLSRNAYAYSGSNFYPSASSGYNRYNGYPGNMAYNNPNTYPNNYYDRNRYGGDRYVGDAYGNRYGSYGYGSGYGSAYPGSEYPTYDESACLEKTRYAARQCEDSFAKRQKEAREQRTSVDVQRKICCSIYYLRDCLSMTVRDYCRDNNQLVVNILMGEERKREMTIGCREYGIEYCNSSLKTCSLSFLLAAFIGMVQFMRNSRIL